MSLIDFYSDCGQPYSIGDIINYWTTDRWENTHDFIQWLFPTKTASICNPDVPPLTNEVIFLLRYTQAFRHWYKRALCVFARTIGLDCRDSEFVVPKYMSPFYDKWTATNHNMRRITRVIESSMLIGHTHAAQSLYACATNVYRRLNNDSNPTIYWDIAYLTKTQYNFEFRINIGLHNNMIVLPTGHEYKIDISVP